MIYKSERFSFLFSKKKTKKTDDSLIIYVILHVVLDALHQE